MNFEQANTILNDNHVTVEFSDTFVDGAGTVTKMPEMGGWSLSWSHGVIFLGGKDFPKALAQQAAAVFVKLWLGKIDAQFADELAVAWMYFNSGRTEVKS